VAVKQAGSGDKSHVFIAGRLLWLEFIQHLIGIRGDETLAELGIIA
jgi:hypothetical protein